MITVERSVTIDCPVEEVFAFVSNPARIPEWRKDVLESTGPKSGAGVGTEFIEKINFMGKKDFTMKIREFDPNHREVIENIAGPGVRPTQSFTFTPSGNSTMLNVHVSVRTHGLFRLLEPLLPKMIGKNWDGYLETLKNKLERGA